MRSLSGLLELRFYFVADALDLAGVGSCRQDKKVGEGGDVAKVQDADIFGLLAIGGSNGGEPGGLLYWFSGFGLS
jgi:hypothetical protein